MAFQPPKSLGRKSPLDIIRFLYHLPKTAALFLRLMGDKRVPILAKALPYAGLIYFISPLDLAPDFPAFGLGYVDDLVIGFFLLKFFFKLCPEDVVREHVEDLSKKGKPVKRP